MSRNMATAVHLFLIILQGANQYLIPAFSQLSPMQIAALTGFIAVVIGGVQMTLGIAAYTLTPSGAPAGQSVVTTAIATDLKGAVTGMIQSETHAEPDKGSAQKP